MSTACPILLWDHLAVAAPGQGPPVIATLEACDSIPAFCTFLDGLTPGPRSNFTWTCMCSPPAAAKS